MIAILISHNSLAQDIFYPEIEPELTEGQKIQLDQAKKILKKATGNENNAKVIDRKYAKLERKKNKSDWEKKTWEAKNQRILAEKNYQIAYRMIFDLYSDLISNASYAKTEDETKALSLNDDAYSKFENADTKLIQFKDIEREQLETSSYEEIKNDISEIHNLQVKGIGYQVSALELISGISVKTQMFEEDAIAWEKAQKENTIAAYKEYIDKYPRSENILKANEYINDLEQNKVFANNNSRTNSRHKSTMKQNKGYDDVALHDDNYMLNENDDPDKYKNVQYNKLKELNSNRNISDNQALVFKVQIAASKTDLTKGAIHARAPSSKNIEIFYNNDWNKYASGEFKTYQEAAKYRDIIKQTTFDAFVVVFSKGEQIEVTNEMKNIAENL